MGFLFTMNAYALLTGHHFDAARLPKTLKAMLPAQCEGSLRLIAALRDPAIIRKILAHLGTAPSRRTPGPAPPESGAAAS